jgi:hypothetical protein
VAVAAGWWPLADHVSTIRSRSPSKPSLCFPSRPSTLASTPQPYTEIPFNHNTCLHWLETPTHEYVLPYTASDGRHEQPTPPRLIGGDQEPDISFCTNVE